MNRNLTERQIDVLPNEFNLADGHSYRPWSVAERGVVGRIAQIFSQVDRRQLDVIVKDYLGTFFTLGRQTLDTERCHVFPCFTASAGIEIIANYLRLNDLSATLIEPCFDNLKDILRRHQVPLVAFPDELLEAEAATLETFLETLDTDVLFLVSPNNPTGSALTRTSFDAVVGFCQRRGVTLILDTCFRFYLPSEQVYDQYELLIESDIDFIVIEDTGKTWPTLEIKAPFLAVSTRLSSSIESINSDFLLHVSPFAIALVEDFVKTSIADDRKHIRDIVACNRDALRVALSGTTLTPVEKPFMSVAWLDIGAGLTAHQVVAALSREGVDVLPGNKFFWTDESRGDRFVRVALMRDPVMFTQAVETLGAVCRRLVA